MLEREARGVVVPMSKIPRRGFSIRSVARDNASPAIELVEPAGAIFGHVDNETRPNWF